MKKTVLRIALFAIAISTLASFAPATKTTPPVKYVVNKQESSLNWVGKKVTGQHTGTIDISSGELTAEGKLIKSGSFEIDVTSLKVTDVTNPEGNAKLVGHLKNDDFFGVDKYPKAKFVISSVKPLKDDEYTVAGKLTIKDVTNDVEFPALVKTEGKKLVATAKIIVDRTKYGIKFRSTNFFENLGDKAIYNDFELNVKLTADSAPGL
jgi:polyisoprenoid-binding protein YceI